MFCPREVLYDFVGIGLACGTYCPLQLVNPREICQFFFLQLRPLVNLATMVNYKKKNDNGQHLQILALFVLIYDIMIILSIRNP